MNTNSINNLRLLPHFSGNRGFTIVELLIVIVVIGILAAIVIVAYNGVTNSANATKAKSNAGALQKKAEAYYSDVNGGNGLYPACATANGSTCTTGAFSTATGLGAIPSGISIGAANPTATNGTTTLRYTACGASSANNNSATGYYIAYWDFSASPAAVKYYVGGTATGSGGTGGNGNFTSVTCPATASTA